MNEYDKASRILKVLGWTILILVLFMNPSLMLGEINREFFDTSILIIA